MHIFKNSCIFRKNTCIISRGKCSLGAKSPYRYRLLIKFKLLIKSRSLIPNLTPNLIPNWFASKQFSFGDICILPLSGICTRSTRTSWSCTQWSKFLFLFLRVIWVYEGFDGFWKFLGFLRVIESYEGFWELMKGSGFFGF